MRKGVEEQREIWDVQLLSDSFDPGHPRFRSGIESTRTMPSGLEMRGDGVKGGKKALRMTG